MRDSVKFVVTTVLGVAFLLSLVEGSVFLAYRFSEFVPGLTPIVRSYHLRANSNIIQFMPQCSQYHPRLTYTLKPGGCEFSNMEYSTRVRVNSKNVRDSEEALSRPEVLFLGDSMSMGWGVEEEERYSSILASRLAIPTLNASIASYGTVREMRMLDEIDTSAVKAIVLQYSLNDYFENLSFVESDYTLKNTSQEEYEQLVRDHSHHSAAYWPGRYGLGFMAFVLNVKRGVQEVAEPGMTEPQSTHARLFLQILVHWREKLRGIPVVLIALGNNDASTSVFIETVRSLVAEEPGRFEDLELLTVDLDPQLTQDMFFMLDGHLTREGHQAVADAIEPVLRAEVPVP